MAAERPDRADPGSSRLHHGTVSLDPRAAIRRAGGIGRPCPVGDLLRLNLLIVATAVVLRRRLAELVDAALDEPREIAGVLGLDLRLAPIEPGDRATTARVAA